MDYLKILSGSEIGKVDLILGYFFYISRFQLENRKDYVARHLCQRHIFSCCGHYSSSGFYLEKTQYERWYIWQNISYRACVEIAIIFILLEPNNIGYISVSFAF